MIEALSSGGSHSHAVADSTATCRPDQLFGLWAIEPERMRHYVALAKAADLAQLRAESMAAAEKAAAAPPYQVTADGIAVIDLNGPLTKYPTSFQALFGGTAMIRVREALRAAVRDPDVLGIMLRIDSPGGTVAGGAELAADIRRAAARKPLYAYADDQAASGALLALAQARQAYGSPGAQIGSLGVYMVVEDTSQQYQQHGVKVYVISSAPPIKGAGVDGTEITAAQIAEWERRVADIKDWFVGEVATGRRQPIEAIEKLATGQVWVAEKAREFGLIDGVMTFDEALARLRSEVMAEQDLKAAVQLAEEAQALADTEKAARLKAEAEASALKEQLGKLEAKQRAELFAVKAKALKLPNDAAGLLDSVEKAIGADAFAKLETCFKALGAQIDESKLFGEIGTSGSDPGGAEPEDALKALANAILAKGEAKEFYAAYELACTRRPDLMSAARPGRKED